MVFASWIAYEVEERVFAGGVGVDEKSRIRLLKLAAYHSNTLAPGGRAAVAKSPGRNIGEYDKDSVLGRMLNASHVLSCVAGHEVARVDLAVRKTLYIIQPRDLVLSDPQVAGPEGFSSKEMFPLLGIVRNARTHFEILKALADPVWIWFAEFLRPSHWFERDTGGRSSKNVVHGRLIPVNVLSFNQAPGDFLCGQTCRFS